jgi:hypothetical protein
MWRLRVADDGHGGCGGPGTAEALLDSTDTSTCYPHLHLVTLNLPCSEQKIAQFRTHYLTKELAYVSTQQSGQDTMDTKMIYVSTWPDC